MFYISYVENSYFQERLVEVEPSICLISSDILAKILVAQLTSLGVSNGDIQDSNSPTPPFDVSKKCISSDILIMQINTI